VKDKSKRKLLQEKHVTAESQPIFSNSLFSHGPDMLLMSPTQIPTQFVSLWTGHVTAESHQNYYTIWIWARYVTGQSHTNSYIMYLDAPALVPWRTTEPLTSDNQVCLYARSFLN